MKDAKNNFLGIAIGLIALVASSYVSFDLPLNNFNIPISLQSLAVLLIAFFLGRMNGMIVILLYLILGALNLPVFADGNAGVEVLRGKSGGYLFGFLFAVLLLESYCKSLKSGFAKIFIYMTLGTFIILMSGGIRLLQFYDINTVWEHGIKPFLAGGLLKILLGSGLAYYFQNKMNLAED